MDSISIRTMRSADVALGLRLSAQAGWNQVESDWKRVLHLAREGVFIAETLEGPVGTAAVVRFGDVAWIALVLVEQSHRGRGIGTALMRQAITFCDSNDIATIRLDATPLGRPVYEKLGFVPRYEVIRFAGEMETPATIPSAEVTPARGEDLDQIAQLDRQATGCDRRSLLARLFQETPQSLWCVRNREQLTGFAHARLGREAMQIGPCLTRDDNSGRILLAATASPNGRRYVYLDVPRPNTSAVVWARSHRLAEQRILLRMERGRSIDDRPDLIWTGSGPEKG